MKRNKLAVLTPLLFILSGCLTGNQEYTFSKKYKYDDEFHWQYAIGHTEVKRNYAEHEWGDEKVDAIGQTYRQCVVCKFKQFIDSTGGGFSSVTEFSAPIDIHTEYQKKYLSYTDNTYDKMPQNSYPDGSKNISDPEFTKIYCNS